MTAVYVACPIGDRTGGPEALTLMVHALRQRGVEAALVPMRSFRGREVPDEYRVYDYAVVQELPKRQDAILVLTEVSPIESHRELQQVPNERTWMVWLSVNFSPIPQARYYQASEATGSMFPPAADLDAEPPSVPALWPYDYQPLSGPGRTLREAARRRGGWRPANWRPIAVEAVSIRYAERLAARPINHGTQSYYGQGFVRSALGRDAFMLPEYVRPARIPLQPRRPNLVLYNGKKGQWKIPELRALVPEADFQPIQDMTYDEVCMALASAALYVEIGHLPGRDRLPREAANLGTPVVMLARGAGYCWADFPIGVKYRIPYTVDWAHRMAPVIREVLADPTEINEVQQEYRELVAAEPEGYERAMDAWVEQLTRE